MNLDLNLGPFVHPPQDDQPHNNITLEDLLRGTMMEVVSNPPTTSHRLPPVNENKRPPNDNDNESSFFDCNICLDLATEPVVTCCGHLFCWPCIYRWLFVHSTAKQCPICKGEVTMKTITPIYSRSNRANIRKALDPNLGLKIPSRPLANRIESWRHAFQRDALNLPIIDMVRRLDNNRSVLTNPQEISGSSLLNRIFTSRGIRTGRDSVPDSVPDSVSQTLPDDYISISIPDLTSAESFIDSYFQDNPEERNQAELPLIDRHSMAGVADIMQSEIVTGLRRRREASTSRVFDVESGNGNSRLRRRLQ